MQVKSKAQPRWWNAGKIQGEAEMVECRLNPRRSRDDGMQVKYKAQPRWWNAG